MAECVRTVFHVDMDAFFVSVEELFDPSLQGKPVVVGGQRHERGVVSAASYEARKFGVHSAMPLRTAARLCPQAIFVDGHPDRYRDCSEKVYSVLTSFSPQVEMVSIDEAYLDMSGTRRLHGPPLLAAHKLHQRMKAETQLNCSIGIGTSRLIAKVCSGKAKPHGVLYVVPGQETRFLAPLDVRDIPGVGKVTEQKLQSLGIRTVGDMARKEDTFLDEHLGKWGLALAGKARGEDAGAWFAGEIGDLDAAKSISHEHTYNEDTADIAQIEATLMRLSEMVARRLREQKVHARTLQLKLRYKDFTTITRAHSVEMPTQLDNEIFYEVRKLFHANWRPGSQVRLLGVQASSFSAESSQADLLSGQARDKWQQALSAVDRVREKFGESSVRLGTGMKGGFRERTHENPAALPGKSKPPSQ
ncbi:MAG: DNA polymerase IV [Acidobacteria bacterium]|nr:MAG: DNA polymerase IV [Acidobacteriota bacterium]PYV68151.1 MAG: DNA polymerase IV [Acidobacteriota bacterium]PYV78863.1 MAG: DNA polymerase IV [Acidobacteriota bacterium]